MPARAASCLGLGSGRVGGGGGQADVHSDLAFGREGQEWTVDPSQLPRRGEPVHYHPGRGLPSPGWVGG